MSDYGFQILKNGKLWASPQYTPIILVQVIDRNNMPLGSNSTITTNVPNDRRFVVFAKTQNQNAACGFYLQNGSSGYKEIVINFVKASSEISSVSVRFYIFSDFVSYAPERGIYFYRDNRMVWCGNTLPLQMKYKANTDPNPGISCATQSGYASGVTNAVPGSNASLVVLSLWCGSPSGITATPFQEINSSGPGTLPPNSPGCLYIETGYYDQYYIQSLGY